MTAQMVGDFREELGEKPTSHSILVLDSGQMFKHWRRVSLSSDFIARYYSYYFPYKEKAKERISRDAAENSISYILNELIENTAKYSDARDKTVDIRVWLLQQEMVFKISNYVTPALAESFRKLAREILAGNPEELYIRRLERNTETDGGDSGLGYLTLINDYGIGLSFKFEAVQPDLFQVTVQARMKCKEG
jgi:hypothetical protein